MRGLQQLGGASANPQTVNITQITGGKTSGAWPARTPHPPRRLWKTPTMRKEKGPVLRKSPRLVPPRRSRHFDSVGVTHHVASEQGKDQRAGLSFFAIFRQRVDRQFLWDPTSGSSLVTGGCVHWLQSGRSSQGRKKSLDSHSGSRHKSSVMMAKSLGFV